MRNVAGSCPKCPDAVTNLRAEPAFVSAAPALCCPSFWLGLN